MKYKYIAECPKCPQLRNETPTPIRSPNFVAMCWGQYAEGSNPAAFQFGPAFFKGDKLFQKFRDFNEAPDNCKRVITLLKEFKPIWSYSSQNS